MDPNTGKLYETKEEALAAGVKHPISVTPAQAERYAKKKKLEIAEKKKAQKKRHKAQKMARKRNR